MTDGDSAEDEDVRPDANQNVIRSEVGRDLIQVEGVGGDVTINGPAAPPSPSRAGLSVVTVGVTLLAGAALVIPGALYIRSQHGGDSQERQGGGLVAGSASQGPQRSSPVRPTVKVVTDTDPLNLGSTELAEIYGRNQDWLIPRPGVVKGRPPDTGERPAAGFYKFVKERGGVAVNRVFFSATIQNVTGGAVYLRSMRVTDLTCGPALKGTRVWSGGGADPLTPRAILVDLDASGPAPLYLPRIPENWLFSSGRSQIDPGKAKPFGFTLPAGGSESFDVVALNFKRRSCEFKLAITAVLNGRGESITLDDGGRPFRVNGDSDNDYWMYGVTGAPWARPGGGDNALKAADQPLAETDT